MVTQSITISFEVPDSSDWPSERLAKLKEMTLEAIEKNLETGWYDSKGGATKGNAYAEERAIAEDILTES
jgi:hypothetical protein